MAHLCAEARFAVVAPVFAVEAEEDRGVGDGQCGFEDEDVDQLSGLVDVGDELFVGHGLHRTASEQLGDLFAVGCNAGSVLLGNEGQFGVHEDFGPHVDGFADGLEDEANHFELSGVGLNGFNSRRRLQGIGRVDDQDPVAVAEQRQVVADLGLPTGGSRGRSAEESGSRDEEDDKR